MSTYLGYCVSWAALGGTILAATPPQITNRSPEAGEIGYRPQDGATVALNPPSWIWLHEPQAQSYSVQWAPQNDFRDAVTARAIPWNTYTHHETLAPGTYYWRYRYVTRAGLESDWSQTRSVTVPREAVAFPMPSRAQQRARAPQGHPRLFLRPEDVPRLRDRAQGPAAARFASLRNEADRILQAGPTPEPEHLGSARDKDNAELVKYWWPNREQTMKACQEAETLAFVHLLTGEPKYAGAARRWILHLAAWNPDGPTNFRLNCEAAKPLLYRLPRAYDWAWSVLSADDRQQVQHVMRRRLEDAWESGEVLRGVGHLNRPFNSHGNRVWHKIGEAGLAFLGEVPEAATWLDYAVNKFHACYPVWADEDGGWHEGVSYWAGYMSKAVWWLQVANSALAIDGLKKPFFAQVGDYPLYLAPPGSPNMGFGDLSFRPPSRGWGGFLEFFIRAKGQQSDGARAAYWHWWAEQWKMQEQDGILGFLYQNSLGPMPAAKAPTDLPPSKVFRGIGIASLHTSLLDSREDVHFLFKSSPFGTQSHGHNPHNTFQLNAYGEALLTTCVYRDLHGSKFHYQWAHSTKAHNGVLVDGEGQIPHTPAPHGHITDFQLTPRYDYLVGDAAPAYGGRLERYQRHVAFVKTPAPVLVLWDDLEAKAPATYQFMLHALAPFEVDEARAALAVEQPKAGVTAKYFAPGPLRFRQWDGYQPPPDKPFPNQWHLEAGTAEPSRHMALLTAIVPHRAGHWADWSGERMETETAVGVRLIWNNQPIEVAFRKPGVRGPAQWRGQPFGGPVLVR